MSSLNFLAMPFELTDLNPHVAVHRHADKAIFVAALRSAKVTRAQILESIQHLKFLLNYD